ALTVHGADGDAAHVHRQADLVPLGDVELDAVEVLATAGHALGDSVELLGVVVVVVARHALAGDPLALAVVAGDRHHHEAPGPGGDLVDGVVHEPPHDPVLVLLGHLRAPGVRPALRYEALAVVSEPGDEHLLRGGLLEVG